MKVNILTQPLFCNYGGILQNYALQQVVKRLGHEPLTVNVPTRKPGPSVVWKDTIKSIINGWRKLNGSYQAPFLSPHTFKLKEHELSFPQREFVEKYICRVDEKAPFTVETCQRYPAEAWIVGSDQIWRPWCSPYLENCFFDFVPDETIKIAYAASFGTDNWEIDPITTSKLAKLGKRFHAISVREESGVKLAKENLGLDVEHVLDPTMLLSAEDYLSLIRKGDSPEGKYIASYVLDINSEKAKKIKRLAKENGLPIHRIGRMHEERFDSVESWIAGIANAEYVITDSFHGTVFSLIFRRPVRILGNNTRGNTRLSSLLTTLRLQPDSVGFIRMTPEAEDILLAEKKKAINFLKEALTI